MAATMMRVFVRLYKHKKDGICFRLVSSRLGCHFTHAISPLTEIKQPGAKQTATQQVALTETLQQLGEKIRSQFSDGSCRWYPTLDSQP